MALLQRREGDTMKAKIETTPVKFRGIEIESESEEEKEVLETLWAYNDGLATLTRLDNGNVQLVIAPTFSKPRGFSQWPLRASR